MVDIVKKCVDFEILRPGIRSNPWEHKYATFTGWVNGNLLLNLTIARDNSNIVGLVLWRTLRIEIPGAYKNCIAVHVKLMRRTSPGATLKIFDQNNVSIGSLTMSVTEAVPESLHYTAPAGVYIKRAELEAPQNEVLLLEFCYEYKK